MTLEKCRDALGAESYALLRRHNGAGPVKEVAVGWEVARQACD